MTGAWFGTLLPYVEGFGGIQAPTSSHSGHAQWNAFGCGRDRTFVITYDTRRYPNGPRLRFRWFDRWREGFASDSGIFTITASDGGRYYYRGNTRRR